MEKENNLIIQGPLCTIIITSGPAAYDTSGNAWVWGGISISGTYDPNGL